MMDNKYARFAVRSDGDLILGKNFRDCLEPGALYEVVDVLGELVIRKVGLSAATVKGDRNMARYKSLTPEPQGDPHPNEPQGATYTDWGRDVSALVMDGDHLLTMAEIHERTIRSYVDAVRNSKIDPDDVHPDYLEEVERRLHA